MNRVKMIVTGVVAGVVLAGGCGVLPTTGANATASAVAAKAADIAATVGGAAGYGGVMMAGYDEHMPSGMGFHNSFDLAPAEAVLMMEFRNESSEACTFDMHYVASRMGLDEQMMDVSVPPGETITVEIPCAEMVGVGPLGTPGAPGCRLTDGGEVANTMAVPGFLAQEYVCGGTYEHVLTPDVDDLDGDGDTDELILVSDAMEMHRQNGGPMGHSHGMGMMGSHMGL